jgi:phosphate transport system substrate-binding protein
METSFMTKLLAFAAAAAMALAGGGAQAQAARDQVWAAGSSTVFPFSTRVAEQFARKTGRKAPKIESLGTGGGIKLFCGGVGAGFPDIANASRPMKASEFDACAKNGVRDIAEIKIGFDGIVVASDRGSPNYNMRLEHLYLALAADVLRGGQIVKNPYKSWDEIGNGLPKTRIQVYGPPPTSGTRDAFNELAMEGGARVFPTLNSLRESDEKTFKQRAATLRRDGAWIDAGENDNAIVGTLTKTPGALGVFGYSFLEENGDKVKAARINGVAPTPQTISTGEYPVSRSLFIYVKKAHLQTIPGLREYVAEFASDAATGRGGYLQDRGLIPLPAAQHAAMKTAAASLPSMARPKS